MVDNGPTLVSTKACWVSALQVASMSGCRLLFVPTFRSMEMDRALARAVQKLLLEAKAVTLAHIQRGVKHDTVTQ